MQARTFAVAGLAALLLAAGGVRADWEPIDGHKMHFPQLPDPFGWDVEISSVGPQHESADDWMCSQTGPVGDIHFWYSVQGDGATQIDHVMVTIYDDDRSGQYSQPGNALWERLFHRDTGDFTVRHNVGEGLQGFADPQYGDWRADEHVFYHQLNIVDIEDPFVQEEGTIYWLGLYVWWDEWPQSPVGWKTSLVGFEDAAVYRDLNDPTVWLPLDPAYGDISIPRRLDFAFVITPEPGTIALLALGGLVMVRRRRK